MRETEINSASFGSRPAYEPTMVKALQKSRLLVSCAARGLVLLATLACFHSIVVPQKIARPLPHRDRYVNDYAGSLLPVTQTKLETVLSNKVLAQAPSRSDQSRQPDDERFSRSPRPPFRQVFPVLVLFAIAITLVLFFFVGSVVVAIKITKRIYLFGHNRQFGAVTATLLLLFSLLALFISTFALPSQVAIAKSWENVVGQITEESYWSTKFFGVQQNRYKLNIWGELIELHLKNASIDSFEDLPRINELSALQVLEVTDTPLTGTLDVSPFSQLRTIRLRNTKLRKLRGLDKLPNLDTLDIENSPLERLETIGTARTLNLTKTEILDFAFLASSAQLENLKLSGSDLTHVVGLHYASTVKKLDLSYCSSVPLDQVAFLDRLEELKLDYSDVEHLSSLSNMSNLLSLSLVGTKISNPTDLERTKVAFLDVRETSLLPEELAKSAKHQMVIIYGDKAFWQEVQQEQQTRSKRFRILAYLLLVAAVLMFVPIPRHWQRRRLLVSRRIARRLLLGGLFIVWLQPGVYPELPIYFVNIETPLILKLFRPENKNLWAAMAGFLWLILLPVLDVLLETKGLGKSKWWPVVQRLSRVIPALAIFGPVMLIIVILLVLMIPTIEFPVSLVLLIPLIIFVAVAICLGVFVYAPSALWIDKLHEVQRLIAAEHPSRKQLMVIALHYRLVGTGARAVMASFYDAVVKDLAPRRRTWSDLMMVPNIGMLANVSIDQRATSAVSGIVFFLPQEHLERARPWELKLLSDWTMNVYRHTNLPVWVVADWAEDTETKSAALVANMTLVNSLLPYLSGIEKNLQADPLVIVRNPPRTISDSLAANALTLQDGKQISVDSAQEQAFTPIASLLRLTFGYQSLLDRLDTLLRATEFSIMYFTLVLATEFESEGSDYPALQRQEVEKLIAQLKGSLAFGAWEKLFFELATQARSPIATKLRQTLEVPANKDAKDMERLFTKIKRSATAESTQVKTRKDILSRLRQLRNVTTGHGPATSRIGGDLYAKTLTTVTDFISNLPWQDAITTHISKEGLTSSFQGCLPRRYQTNGEKPGTYLLIRNEQFPPTVLDASKYFHYVDDTDSIALYVGRDGYLDPVSGIRLSV